MTLTEGFNLLATAPDGIKRLRELILSLAVQGKLVPQDPNDEPASELLKQIRAEKDRLIAEGKIKKDKPLPTIGDDEKPFALPEGWEWARLGQLGDWAIGSGFPTSEQGLAGLDVLFAKVSDMNLPGNELEIVAANNTISWEQVERLRVNVHPAGTVVFPKIGGAIATNKRRKLIRPTAIDNNCLGISPNGLISTNYLFLLLTSIDFTEYQAGTSVPALSQSVLANIVLALPPLSEQSRIVAKVEELMTLCDALEARGQLEAGQHARLTATLFDALAASESAHQLQENWARLAASFDLVLDRPQAVDALEQTLLQLAVRGLLVPQDPADEPASELLKQIRAEKDRLIAEGKIKKDKPLPAISEEEKPFELPLGWEWCRLADIASFENGDRSSNYPSKAHQVDSGVPFVNAGHLINQRVDFSAMNFITPERFELLRSGKVSKGDFLYCLRGSLGKFALVDFEDDAAIASSLIIVRFTKLQSAAFVETYLASSLASGLIRLFDNGTAQPNLSGSDLAKFVFPLPPLAEQSRIVARVEVLRTLSGQLRERLAASRQTQAHLAEVLVAQT